MPTACSISQSEQLSYQSDSGQGVSVAKKYKSDKIKVIFFWEVESELPTGIGPLGLRHFYCSVGQCRGPVWGVNQGITTDSYSKASALHSMLPKPSLPLANLGRWVRGHSCWVFI